MRWCTICGSGFSDDEIRIDADCPDCGSPESLIQCCDECEARLPDDGAIGGLCRSCAEQRITYASGKDYLKHAGYLVDFVFDRLYGAFVPTGQDPEQARKTVELAEKLYERKVLEDLLANTRETLDELISYILDDDECFADAFVEWAGKEGSE